MKRRLFGVFLTLFTSVAALFAYAPPATAAGETYIFDSQTGNIVGAKGVFDQGGRIPPAGVFVKNGNNYILTPQLDIAGCKIAATISSVVTKPDGSATGTLNAAPLTGCSGPPGITSSPIDIASSSAAGTGGGSADPVDCQAGSFGWLICGAIKLLVSVVDTIRDKVIVPFLKEPPLDSSSPDYKTAFGIWGTFRNLASVFFILIFFLIVIGTAAGFDNYT
ncbi:MAG TPA: hypothetical protein VMT30_00610, partial [Candidatus Saccharimonadia bacterium]|nr:hypothetical protein [Candidatus Saccharimonadia bacterium]